MYCSEKTEQEKVWYAMRALYRTEFKTQSVLTDAGIRTFLPVKETIITRQGRRRKAKVPAVSSLIFVHSTEPELSPFTARDSKFQFIFRRGGKANEPLVVPERQMENFIRVCELSEKHQFYSPEELNLARGTRIRIIGGVLDGTEGTLLKVSGARSRKLVVSIPGTINVAVEVSPDLIEIIKQ